MKKRKKSEDKAQVSLSAMIDVVFLLLLFFVATHVATRSEAFVSIDHSQGRGGNPQPALEAEIHPDGYRFMGRPMPLERLESCLMDTATMSGGALIIKVSPRATEGQLVALLDRCRAVNLTNLNVMTLREDYGRSSSKTPSNLR